MSNLRSGVLPLLFGRRGEKDAWYIYFTCSLPIVQNMTFVWLVKNKRSFGALHRLVKEHIWLPELLDRFCRPHLFMTETTRWSRNLLTASLSFNTTISDKIVETYSNRVTSENRRIHSPPLSPPFKVGVFCCFLKIGWIVAQHCMEGMGEEKLYFPLLKSGKCQKAPLGRSVSTYFVGDCSS